MATRPDVSAFNTHEERVRAFMASIPERRRRRVEAKFSVLDHAAEQLLRSEECIWSPDVLDRILASPGPVHHSPLKADPSAYQEG